jgi:hypothetical protein
MARPKEKGPYPGEWNLGDTKAARNQFYKWTGEQPRAIKKGEFYLSGSRVFAYRAPNDLEGPYFPPCPFS